MKPTVSRLRAEGFKVKLIDVRSHGQQAFAAGVRRIPTSIYRVHGKEVRRRTGRLSEARLRDFCRGF